MARMGMDVDAVESIARSIQGDADRLGQLTANVEALVRKLPGLWDGADASRFVQQWWPQHRKTLTAVQESVRGLGQSALNNAAEQRQASNASGGPKTSSSGAASASAPDSGTTSPASTGSHSVASGQLGSTDVGRVSSPPPSQQAYDSWANPVYGPNGEYGKYCTAWVQFRRAELGLPLPTGNGGQTAGSLASQSETPSLGAVGSYYNGAGDHYGHTFIVEGISSVSPRTIEISQMNVGKMVNEKDAITTGFGQVQTGSLVEVAPGRWRDSFGTVHTINFGQ